jgi:hypothetical protein
MIPVQPEHIVVRIAHRHPLGAEVVILCTVSHAGRRGSYRRVAHLVRYRHTPGQCMSGLSEVLVIRLHRLASQRGSRQWKRLCGIATACTASLKPSRMRREP